MEERLAPGHRTMHIKDGWNFSRQGDGDIRIHIVDPKAQTEATMLRWQNSPFQLPNGYH